MPTPKTKLLCQIFLNDRYFVFSGFIFLLLRRRTTLKNPVAVPREAVALLRGALKENILPVTHLRILSKRLLRGLPQILLKLEDTLVELGDALFVVVHGSKHLVTNHVKASLPPLKILSKVNFRSNRRTQKRSTLLRQRRPQQGGLGARRSVHVLR